MAEILTIIQNASPALAAVIVCLVFSVRGIKKDLETLKESNSKDIENLKERIDEYDALNVAANLAKIQSDLSWIRAKLEGKI